MAWPARGSLARIGGFIREPQSVMGVAFHCLCVIGNAAGRFCDGDGSVLSSSGGLLVRHGGVVRGTTPGSTTPGSSQFTGLRDGRESAGRHGELQWNGA